jgi:rifampicin phosphotransferase
VWRLLLSFERPSRRPLQPPESRFVASAGSRIFLNLTALLRHPLLRRVFGAVVGHAYADLGQGLMTLTRRPAFLKGPRRVWATTRSVGSFLLPIAGRVVARAISANPDRLRAVTESFCESQLDGARQRLARPGALPVRLREATRVLGDIFAPLFSFVPPFILLGILAQRLLVKLTERGLFGASLADISALERGLPGNVTTEMDLAVGDLADRVRSFPALMELFRTRPAPEALALAADVPGGPAFLEAWQVFMKRYGMRGPGEIDISRPRYADDPALVIGVIVAGNAPAGALRAVGQHRAHHALLAREAEAAGERVVASARRGRLGWLWARLARRLVRLARAGSGLREHPKYELVRVLGLVREVVREAGVALVQRGTLRHADDVYLFRFEELIAALEAASAPDWSSLCEERRSILRRDAQRAPPFVMASDGEVPELAVRADVPAGALSGTAASAGVVEGVARVVLDPARALLQAGEILVAPHTDPGWTPLFVHAAGLVTEVGGLMTHGSVVAREYGIPAVVSVAGATRRIVTGQRIRVDGTRGFVELLDTGGEDAPA